MPDYAVNSAPTDGLAALGVRSSAGAAMTKFGPCICTRLTLSLISPSWVRLARKCNHFDEIFITGSTESCQNDNFQCCQWWKFYQNDISVSVYVPFQNITWEVWISLQSFQAGNMEALTCLWYTSVWSGGWGHFRLIIHTPTNTIYGKVGRDRERINTPNAPRFGGISVAILHNSDVTWCLKSSQITSNLVVCLTAVSG